MGVQITTNLILEEQKMTTVDVSVSSSGDYRVSTNIKGGIRAKTGTKKLEDIMWGKDIPLTGFATLAELLTTEYHGLLANFISRQGYSLHNKVRYGLKGRVRAVVICGNEFREHQGLTDCRPYTQK
ncbi:hypothetical protein KC850_04055 [Candidatus Kaiserbacteria bacterium]|nr:hypothetical protein [Candidatus Kaiserbacteria bacterium]